MQVFGGITCSRWDSIGRSLCPSLWTFGARYVQFAQSKIMFECQCTVTLSERDGVQYINTVDV